jgi:hypothetical protein
MRKALRGLIAIAQRIAGWDWANASRREQMLSWLALESARAGYLEEALSAARELPKWHLRRSPRAEMLAELAKYLSDREKSQMLMEAFTLAKEIIDLGEKRALASLATRFAELGYPEWALKAVQALEDEAWRAQVLARIGPYLPPSVLGEALVIARTIEQRQGRRDAVTGLSSNLATLPGATLQSLWLETLPVLASRTRPDLLADLRALIPALVALGGEDVVKETVAAIKDVGRWWP